MNQTLDLLSSYLIGGIIVLGLAGLMITFNNKSQETKASEIAQSTSEIMGDVIEHDFNKLGYGVTGSKIVSITDSSITFLADIDNDQNVDTVSYSTIKQNNKLFLSRKFVKNNQTKLWSVLVQSFAVAGIDSTGSSTYTPSSIKGIDVKVLLTKESFSNSKYTLGAYWHRKFYPSNL